MLWAPVFAPLFLQLIFRVLFQWLSSNSQDLLFDVLFRWLCLHSARSQAFVSSIQSWTSPYITLIAGYFTTKFGPFVLWFPSSAALKLRSFVLWVKCHVQAVRWIAWLGSQTLQAESEASQVVPHATTTRPSDAGPSPQFTDSIGARICPSLLRLV